MVLGPLSGNVHEASPLNITQVGLMVYGNAQIMWCKKMNRKMRVGVGSGVENAASGREDRVNSLQYSLQLCHGFRSSVLDVGCFFPP